MQHPGDKEVHAANLSTNEFGKRPNETSVGNDAGKESELKKMKTEVPVLSEGQQFINEATKQMMEGGQTVLDQTKEALSKGVDTTKDAISKGVDTTKDAISKGVDTTKDAISKSVDYVSSAAQPVLDKAKEIGSTIGENINSTLLKSAEFQKDLKQKADQIMGQVEKRVEDAAKALKDRPIEDPIKCSLPKDTVFVEEPLIKDKPEEKLIKDKPEEKLIKDQSPKEMLADEKKEEEKKEESEEGQEETKKAPAKGRGRGRPKKSK